ncbi:MULTISPECIES: hypothetical protein [unclassified Streptomyces]|uniref:hypothetical protein n=1 Tax=unclassified Streptomyces TaxID=2593676 RepID=UPI00136B4914|nr:MULTISPECIES: hypothetical protein [unclassified Streptomyces]MYT73591.1 hypothetical protein [Streptomyces sp. SID8367]
MIDPLFYDQTDQTDRMDRADHMDQMDRMAQMDRAVPLAHRSSAFEDAWCPGLKYRLSRRADVGIPLGWFPAVAPLSDPPGMLCPWR